MPAAAVALIETMACCLALSAVFIGADLMFAVWTSESGADLIGDPASPFCAPEQVDTAIYARQRNRTRRLGIDAPRFIRPCTPATAAPPTGARSTDAR